MEINKEALTDFINKMEENGISRNDYMCVIEQLSYLATDNGFDQEGFFDELTYMLEEK